MVKKEDILFHTDTPGASLLLPLLGGYTVRQFDSFSEISENSGVLIAGFRHFSSVPEHQLSRVLLVGEVAEVSLLQEGQWFKRGLYDALLLPINPVLFVEKVGQLVDQARERFVDDAIRKIHEVYESGFSPKELSVLQALLRSRERGVTRKEFGDGVWQGLSVHSKTLDTHLFNLRSKLEQCGLTIVWQRQTQSWFLRSENPQLRLD